MGSDIRKARFVTQPHSGDQINNRCQHFCGQVRAQLLIRSLDLAGKRQQYMLLDKRKRRLAARQVICPILMKIERRTLVDQP